MRQVTLPREGTGGEGRVRGGGRTDDRSITSGLGMARCLTAHCEALPIAVRCGANKRNAELLARAVCALINFASVQGVSCCPSVRLSRHKSVRSIDDL